MQLWQPGQVDVLEGLLSDLPGQLQLLVPLVEEGKHCQQLIYSFNVSVPASSLEYMLNMLKLGSVFMQGPVRTNHQELQLPQLFLTSCVWLRWRRLWLRWWRRNHTHAILWCTSEFHSNLACHAKLFYASCSRSFVCS